MLIFMFVHFSAVFKNSLMSERFDHLKTLLIICFSLIMTSENALRMLPEEIKTPVYKTHIDA